MTKKEYQSRKETIESDIEEIKAYKEKGEIEKFAGLMQIIDDDPLAKAVITDNNGLACDVKHTSESIDAYENLTNITNCPCGMAGGFGNMIYYKYTCEFFDTHKDLILNRLAEDAKELGYKNELEMLNNFECLKGSNITLKEIANLNEKGECEANIKNALAWYAAEETARKFDNLMGCKEDIRPTYLKSAETKMNEYVDKRVNGLNNDLKKLKKDFEKSNANTISM